MDGERTCGRASARTAPIPIRETYRSRALPSRPRAWSTVGSDRSRVPTGKGEAHDTVRQLQEARGPDRYGRGQRQGRPGPGQGRPEGVGRRGAQERRQAVGRAAGQGRGSLTTREERLAGGPRRLG